MKLKYLVFFTFFGFMCHNTMLGQESITASIADGYLKELKLDKDQAKQFKEILEKYAPQFTQDGLKIIDYNSLMKQETLEVYGLLTPEQFAAYKKLKETIEPNKKYRFENKKN